MILLRTKLAARAFIRMSGGYGTNGAIKSMWKFIIIGIAVLASGQMVQLSLCDWQSACLLGFEDQIIRNANYTIVAILGLCAVRSIVVEPVARSLKISPELDILATDFKVPEAALSLSELHGQRGAEAHASIWWERATALEHPETKKRRKS